MFCAATLNCADESINSGRIVTGKIENLNSNFSSQLVIEVYETLMQPNLTDNNEGFEEHYFTYGSSTIDQTGIFEVDCRDCPESAFIRVMADANILHWEPISFQEDTLRLGQIDIRPHMDADRPLSGDKLMQIDIPVDTLR